MGLLYLLPFLDAIVLLKDLEVTWRIILKYLLMKFYVNMFTHRIIVPPNRDQLKYFVGSVIKRTAP